MANSSSSSSSSSQSITDMIALLTESNRILKSHCRHFLTLSVIFILPLSFSITVFPTLFHTFTSPTPYHIQSLLRFSKTPNFHLHPNFHNPNFNFQQTLIFSLLFLAFAVFFGILAISSVTFSVYRGFYGRPVKVLTAFGSVFGSFLPLLVTFVTGLIVVSVVFVIFGGFGYLGIRGIELIVGKDGFNSSYFIAVCLIGGVILGLGLIHSCVNWTLAGVIVVVESKWGFDPLVRSKGLMRGMRWVGLMLMIFFGFFEGVLIWVSVIVGKDDYSGFVNDGWNTWGFVLRVVATSAVLTVLLLHSIAAITVLYMYCKALHGELAEEIVHEFATEYVSLPFDEKKVPHVVCYVH